MADPKTLATIEGSSRAGRAYWMPSGVAFYRKPIVRALSPVALIPIAGYFFNLFLQVRGYQSMMASRWFLYGATAVLIAGVALFASSLPKCRKTVGAVLAVAVIIGAVCLDRFAVPKTEARPVVSPTKSAIAPQATAPITHAINAAPSTKSKMPPSRRRKPEVRGSENTIVGKVPYSIEGSGNTIVGPTDDHGNTIIQPGTTIGAGAKGNQTSVVIGAGAGSATKPDQTGRKQ